jgi:hypothetical protein
MYLCAGFTCQQSPIYPEDVFKRGPENSRVLRRGTGPDGRSLQLTGGGGRGAGMRQKKYRLTQLQTSS